MARKFNGTSDRIDIANESAFDREFNQVFSISAWVNLTSNASGSIFAKVDTAVNGFQLFHRVGTSTPTFAVQMAADLTGDLRTFTTTEWSLATSRHVLAVYDGSNATSGITFYVSGAAQGKTDLANTAFSASTMLNNNIARIGCDETSGTPGLFSNAAISQPAFWTAALTAQNALDLAAGIPPPQVNSANLVSWWKLNGSSPEPDEFGSNPGTVTGTTVVDDPDKLAAHPDRRPLPFIYLRRNA